MSYRVGVVGLGHRGRAMFRGFCSQVEGLIATSACDLRPELWFEPTAGYGGKSEAMCKLMPDVTFYDSYDAMLKVGNLDIIMVETPATNHALFCAKALERGLHVYSDIPTVHTVEEAEMLWKIDARTPGLFMTGATTCGWGFVLEMVDLYRKGLLGRPCAMEAEYIHDCRALWEETPWRRPSAPWSNLPIRYCTHSLGPLLQLLEEDLRTVSCVTSGSKVTDNPFAHDYMTAMFQTGSGVVVKFSASFINEAGCGNHSYRVFGTRGYYEHLSQRGEEHPEVTFFRAKDECPKTKVLPVDFSPATSQLGQALAREGDEGHGGADAYLMRSFVEALKRGDREAPISLKKGLAMTLPGLYAAESAIRGGEKVVIRYPWD